jgi:hypothetical protein
MRKAAIVYIQLSSCLLVAFANTKIISFTTNILIICYCLCMYSICLKSITEIAFMLENESVSISLNRSIFH